MKVPIVAALVLAASVAVPAEPEPYRRSITAWVENKSSQPRHVQVRDLRAGYGIPEDCRVAEKVAALCAGNPRKEPGADRGRKHDMTCAVALALVEEPRCAIEDLIFDDWIDGDMKAKITLFADRAGQGAAAVRAVDNTRSWTFKTGIDDGETISHQ